MIPILLLGLMLLVVVVDLTLSVVISDIVEIIFVNCRLLLLLWVRRQW